MKNKDIETQLEEGRLISVYESDYEMLTAINRIYLNDKGFDLDPTYSKGVFYKKFHPTMKDLKVIEKLVEILTNEDDIILDPFLGSGTTAIACLKLNRKFIGIEKEEEYVKICKARIKPFQEQIRLK